MALLFSLSIHGVLGYSALSRGPEEPSVSSEPIEISQVIYEKPRIEKKESAPAFAPLKRRPAAKAVRSQPVKQAPKPSTGIPAKPPIFKPPAPKTAMDFMTDPQKGKVFENYFGKLKEKIHISLRRTYRDAGDMPGVVTLYFVLNPEGNLVRAGILEKDSDAGASLQQTALDSLKRSAPFGDFPPDLGNGPVAFSLKVYFDELQ